MVIRLAGLIPNSSVDLPSSVFGSGVGGQTSLDFEDRDQDAVSGVLKTDKKPGIDTAFDGFNTGFIGVLQRILTGTPGGILGAGLGALRDLFAIRWDQVDNVADDLGSLQDRTLALEGVIGYAHAFATSDLSSAGDQKRSMSNQIGPSVGVTLSGGSFVLGSQGLWVADVHQTFAGYPFGAADVWVGVRVYTPGGALYSERYSHLTSSNVVTHTAHLPFAVPASGYKVEMWVHGAAARGIWGGSSNNGLSVYKESTETS